MNNQKPGCIKNMTPFILMIGLGVHAVFEGLALGLSSEFESTLIFGIAIILHKGAAGMSLGISMSKVFAGQDTFVAQLLILFALFTPVGVAFGWILGKESEMLEIIFSCLASGSFLYIACSEVIIEEFSIQTHKYLKLFFFLIGIAIISCLKLLEIFGPGDDDD